MQKCHNSTNFIFWGEREFCKMIKHYLECDLCKCEIGDVNYIDDATFLSIVTVPHGRLKNLNMDLDHKELHICQDCFNGIIMEFGLQVGKYYNVKLGEEHK